MASEEFDLDDVFEIDSVNLNDAFCRQPAELAYWNGEYAKAYRAAAAAKANEKQVRAATREVVRERLMAMRGKATLPDIDSALEIHEDVVEATEQTTEADYEKVRIFGIVDAIRAKKDMLISVGAQLRAEMEHDPSIRAQQRNSRITADGLPWGKKE